MATTINSYSDDQRIVHNPLRREVIIDSGDIYILYGDDNAVTTSIRMPADTAYALALELLSAFKRTCGSSAPLPVPLDLGGA